MTVFTFLSNHDNYGVPHIIENEPIQSISDNLINEINENLPGGLTVVDKNPDWIRKSDIYTRDNCELTVTFVTEGAGYKNGLGYYTYDRDSPPNRFSDIDNIYIIFPNASLENKGGKLKPGHTMKLLYDTSPNGYTQDPNPNKRFVIDHLDNNFTFPKDKGIGFVCLANQWKAHGSSGAHLNINHKMYSTDPALNPERSGLKDHCVNFRSESEDDKIIYGFEDLRRDIRSDNDFNDLVYYITPSPIGAIDPNSFNSETKQQFKGYMLCEDIISGVGDFDYNDLAAKYEITEVIERNTNKIKNITIKLQGLSRGADFNHDFGVIFPNIKTVENCKIYREMWVGETDTTYKKTLTSEVIGSGSDRVVLIENTKAFLPPLDEEAHTNTNKDGTKDTLPSYSVTKIIFPDPVIKSGFAQFPYRFYLDVYKKNTGVVDNSIYSDRNYTTSIRLRNMGVSGKKKIIILKDCNTFRVPTESVPLVKAYKKIIDHIKSNGESFNNWHSAVYRNDSMVKAEITHNDSQHIYDKGLTEESYDYDSNILYKSLELCDSYSDINEVKFTEEYFSNSTTLFKDNVSIYNILDWSILVSDPKKLKSLVNFIKKCGECHILFNSEYTHQNNGYYFVSLSSLQTNNDRAVHAVANSENETLVLLSDSEVRPYIPLII